MKEENKQVADNMVVSMTYVLKVNGEELDRADEDDPMIFLQGHENIIPGLEKALYGMAPGESKSVVVAPEDGYGLVDPEEAETIARDMLPEDYEPMIGDPLMLRDTESGEVFEVYITDFDEDSVSLDFNHPLAGETLDFLVTIVDIRPATADELAHGHVHGPGGHH